MKWRHLVASLLALLAGASPARNDLDPAERAQRIERLAQDQRERANDPSWRGPAEQLRRAGDRDYRRQRYSDAARSYRDAYPNYPQAYALLMASDAHLRAVLKSQRALAGDPGRCLGAARFADDLALALWNGLDSALALAARTNDASFLHSRLHARAEPMSTCLHALAERSAARSADGCADLGALQSCLGAPLIR